MDQNEVKVTQFFVYKLLAGAKFIFVYFSNYKSN
jgi:hypothetical protein